MVIKRFVDRRKELELLDKLWSSDKFEFLLLYGRRRVGKSRLLLEFVKRVGVGNALYFLVSDRGLSYNLRRFSEVVCRFYGVPFVRFESLRDVFDFIRVNSKGRRILVVVDEFGYLLKHDPGVASDFQEIVDNVLRGTNVKLVLCSSSVSMMEGYVLSYRSPLYGRSTYNLKLGPLRLGDLREWFGDVLFEDLFKVYSVTGGVPRYLEFFRCENVVEEIEKNFFDPVSFLFRDAIELLKEELREPAMYLQILEAVSLGYNRVSEIANYVYSTPTRITPYLRVLVSLDILERRLPLLSSRREKRGIYAIKDYYFKFWFRFVSPFQSEIESGFLDMPVNVFRRDFNKYLGEVFEEESVKILYSYLIKKGYGVTRIGKWWYRDTEIDIVAVDENTGMVVFAEVKWAKLSLREARRILANLMVKAEKFPWRKDRRNEKFCLIAREIVGKDVLRSEGYFVLDLKDIELQRLHM